MELNIRLSWNYVECHPGVVDCQSESKLFCGSREFYFLKPFKSKAGQVECEIWRAFIILYIYIFFYKLGWALFVTYTIIQSIMRSEMCSLHLTHPSVHTWSSGQPTVQRPGSSRGLPVGAGIRTHNLGLPRVSSPTLYLLGQRLPQFNI